MYFKIRQILGSRGSSSNYYCLLKYNARQFVKKRPMFRRFGVTMAHDPFVVCSLLTLVPVVPPQCHWLFLPSCWSFHSEDGGSIFLRKVDS